MAAAKAAFKHSQRLVSTFMCAGVLAGCDHTGTAANRINGWPKLVPIDAAGKPNAEAEQSARYFDCVHFATRAKCKGAAVTVGFIDLTCGRFMQEAAIQHVRDMK